MTESPSVLDWSNPYRANRSPVFARNLVATSQPLAAWAGVRAMAEGGNAVDAALATAITLTVVEPNNNGIGSDAFAIVATGGELIGLNASGRSPAGWYPERFAGRATMPSLGWDAVTVPGAVSGWVALSERFGKLPFDKLFECAIAYAENGFQVGPKTGYFWRFIKDRYRNYPEFLRTFAPGGRIPAIGDTMRLPEHARTLRSIATTGGESFYRGELALAMVADSDARGGVMSMDDLANHRADWVSPLSVDFGQASLHEIPPNGQGLMALIALGIVNERDIAAFAQDSADAVHLQIEATRIAYAEIERHLADIDHMVVSPETLLTPGYLQARAAQIDMTRANPTPTAMGASPDTVYLCTADASGMMVSMIQSNYRGFGSGIVVPGTGISLQNRGEGFTLEAGHPNQVGPNKRPYHTIIPGFASHGNQPALAFGVMGGHMQAQGHLQMMVRIFAFGQNPQAASDAPRWHLREDGVVCLEDGFDQGVASELGARGHQVQFGNPEHLFGGAQLIYRMPGGYCAGSDHRKEGLALGF
ncbi:MAG: gamma-glutamyltransferase family protein [Pseudomonadota bacterium]